VVFRWRCQIDQNSNQLWPILSALTGENLVSLSYAERLPRLLSHSFGLWDVLGACERQDSLDSAIRKPAADDFAHLRELCLQWANFRKIGPAVRVCRLPHAGDCYSRVCQ
jgi:hypoxanthine-DNA glycosylase